MMSEKLPEIWQDPAESIGELFLEKGLEKSAPALSKIPLLSLAIAAYRSKGAISDYLLARKVQKFYSSWEQLGEDERHKIYQKFQKKPKAFVEKLLLILAQQEDMEKCRLIGYLTSQYLRGELKRAEYLDLLETVASTTLRDLLWLGDLLGHDSLTLRRKEVKERYAMVFVARGLLESERLLPDEQRNDDEPYYSMTKLGQNLAQFVADCELKEAI
jgi:hypothetical protein